MRNICFALAIMQMAACGPVLQDQGREEALDINTIGLGCQPVEFANSAYIVCVYLPGQDDIRLFHSDASGKAYKQFDTLAQSLAQSQETLIFAMNGGMYHEDRSPVGYYRDRYGDRARVNLNDGPGNFHLKPNGVFWLQAGSAGISESTAYLEAGIDPLYATQSGPMLVYDNQIHPAFNPDGLSRKRRNGIGVSASGDTVYFAISDMAVTFYEFAALFRDHLEVPNALFLDGQVSRIYAPELSRSEMGGDLGPIIGVVAPTDE